MRQLLEEIRWVLEHRHLIWYMAMSETKARYRRSVLGPLWLTLGAAVGVVGLGLVWASLLKVPLEQFVPSLTAGMLLWQLISSTVTDSCQIFTRHSQVIRNVPLPVLIYPVQMVIRQLITFAHNLVVLIVVLLIYPPAHSHPVLALAGFALVAVNLLWIAVILGMLGARFRDIEQIVLAVMPLIFFLTPVLYKVDRIGLDQFVVWLNPFTYFISVVRDPLLGIIPGPTVYLVFVLISLGGCMLATLLFLSRRSRIPYWV